MIEIPYRRVEQGLALPALQPYAGVPPPFGRGWSPLPATLSGPGMWLYAAGYRPRLAPAGGTVPGPRARRTGPGVAAAAGVLLGALLGAVCGGLALDMALHRLAWPATLPAARVLLAWLEGQPAGAPVPGVPVLPVMPVAARAAPPASAPVVASAPAASASEAVAQCPVPAQVPARVPARWLARSARPVRLAAPRLAQRGTPHRVRAVLPVRLAAGPAPATSGAMNAVVKPAVTAVVSPAVNAAVSPAMKPAVNATANAAAPAASGWMQALRQRRITEVPDQFATR